MGTQVKIERCQRPPANFRVTLFAISRRRIQLWQ
jgi:hypothetical protein